MRQGLAPPGRQAGQMMRTGGTTRRAAAGITLLELVCAVVLVGILGTFAMAKLGSPLTLTLPTQAQSLADVIRRAQSLAVVRGQRMSVSVAASGPNGSIAIACVTGATPCNTDASFTASQGAVVDFVGPVYFSSLGQPVDASNVARSSPANFTLSYTTIGISPVCVNYTVAVAALSGRVSVTGPGTCP